jgi:hypothetical protein
MRETKNCFDFLRVFDEEMREVCEFFTVFSVVWIEIDGNLLFSQIFNEETSILVDESFEFR